MRSARLRAPATPVFSWLCTMTRRPGSAMRSYTRASSAVASWEPSSITMISRFCQVCRISEVSASPMKR